MVEHNNCPAGQAEMGQQGGATALEHPDRMYVGGRVNNCPVALTPPALAMFPGYSAPAALHASSGGAMGQQAWAPSPCSLPRPCPFLLLLLLLVVPRGAQPQAGRVSTDPLPHSVAEGSP